MPSPATRPRPRRAFHRCRFGRRPAGPRRLSRAGRLEGRTLGRRAAAGQPGRVLLRRPRPHLRLRDLPPKPRRRRQPRPRALARRRPRRQTVEDRLAYIQKHLGDKANDYTKHDDRIRLLEDTDGDGRADKAIVFADRFNGIVDGTGAGVLAREATSISPASRISGCCATTTATARPRRAARSATATACASPFAATTCTA